MTADSTLGHESRSGAIEFRLAIPADAEGIAQLYDDVYFGSYPIAECTDPTLIRRILAADEHIWVIALDGDLVVGASVGRPEPANHTYELCRAAVRREYSGRGNFAVMFDMTIDAAKARPDCQLIYGYARSERARQLFSRVSYRISWVGADGGQHMFLGDREEHLIGVCVNPDRSATRVLPPSSIVRPASLVEREIEALAAESVEGEYPAVLTPGGAAAFTHRSEHGRIWYSVFAPSRTAFISDIEAAIAADARALVWEVLDGFPMAPGPIEHATVYVLADKLELIAELCTAAGDPKRRFTVRGYLPAWYKDGEGRYDCVVLTARTDDRLTARNGLEPLIDQIESSFSEEFR
ncbi:GNAT family N-acetyltransferase [Nocardia sp. NPDC051030]|uniref:GNAT family N-acetyltransferase n=1 Tax=Nocardia sp. NPDC051030 TaxID=3155162 RepID=UPI00342C25F4